MPYTQALMSLAVSKGGVGVPLSSCFGKFNLEEADLSWRWEK
jgi:hypothetical protein